MLPATCVEGHWFDSNCKSHAARESAMDPNYAVTLVFLFALTAVVLVLASRTDGFERVALRLIDLIRDVVKWFSRIL